VTVYNLTVEGDHTYFVDDQVAGGAVWVHNTCAEAKRYWKLKAKAELSKAAHLRQYSLTNINRMSDGLAPQIVAKVRYNDGREVIKRVSIELHHTRFPQRSNAGQHLKGANFNLQEASPWAHAAMDKFRRVGHTLVKIIAGVKKA
jgi:hypothetical protein